MAVTCAYHKKVDAAGACVSCGKLVCEECKVILKGKIYCNPCVEELFAEKTEVAASASPATAIVETRPTKTAAKAQAVAPTKAAAKVEAAVTTDNTSGQGKDAVIPAELRGFNVGAFLMSWIWGIGNKVWISLLALIGPIGFIMAIILGFKGNEWAWQNKTWNSIEHFKKVQRTWMWVGLILLIISIIISILVAMLYAAGGGIEFN